MKTINKIYSVFKDPTFWLDLLILPGSVKLFLLSQKLGGVLPTICFWIWFILFYVIPISITTCCLYAAYKRKRDSKAE